MQAAAGTPPIGDLLRHWRQQRGKSQLQLGLDSGISQRHLSFVESGRSVPSRATLFTIANALNVPLRERNLLLLACGYAPMYDQPKLDDQEMSIIDTAIGRMLQQHEPYPALVLDRYWYVLRTNQAAPQFFGSFIDLQAIPKPRNLLELMFDPAGMRPFILDWESVAIGLLQRLRSEAVGQVLDARLDELLARLRRFPGVRDLRDPGTAPNSPVLPITFVREGQRHSYFSLVTTVGTPQSVTAQELRVECMFPVETL